MVNARGTKSLTNANDHVINNVNNFYPDKRSGYQILSD